jgi:hypothetical protein
MQFRRSKSLIYAMLRFSLTVVAIVVALTYTLASDEDRAKVKQFAPMAEYPTETEFKQRVLQMGMQEPAIKLHGHHWHTQHHAKVLPEAFVIQRVPLTPGNGKTPVQKNLLDLLNKK